MNWRRGITREVVLFGKYALKFPSIRSWKCFLQGLVSNIKEKEHSRLNNPYLCPVIFYIPSGILVIQKRAVIFTENEAEKYDLMRISSEAGIWVEPKASSFGWIDGNIVAVDYGN